jgi:CHAD domain-containing protein
MLRKRPQRARARPLQPAAEGSRRIEAALREQQRLLRAAVERLPDAGSDAIHDGRVAARRMRSLLKTFRPMLDARCARLMRADLRSFARSLALVREADVRRDLLVELSGNDPGLAAEDLQRLVTLLNDRCLEARSSLARHVAEPGWEALVAAVLGVAAIADLGIRPDVTLGDVLGRVSDSWTAAVRRLKSKPTDAAGLHELRLALKHCRYALDPVADVAPDEVRPLLRRLRAAQDGIGEHRDVVLAVHWLSSNESALGGNLTKRLVALLARRERRLRARAATLASRVLPAFRRWRKATRTLTKGTKTGRSRPEAARRSSARS